MKTRFAYNGIEVPDEQDVRYINEHIDAGHPDVKAYIENIGDMLEWTYRELFKYEPDKNFVIEQLALNEECNKNNRS